MTFNSINFNGEQFAKSAVKEKIRKIGEVLKVLYPNITKPELQHECRNLVDLLNELNTETNEGIENKDNYIKETYDTGNCPLHYFEQKRLLNRMLVIMYIQLSKFITNPNSKKKKKYYKQICDEINQILERAKGTTHKEYSTDFLNQKATSAEVAVEEVAAAPNPLLGTYTFTNKPKIRINKGDPLELHLKFLNNFVINTVFTLKVTLSGVSASGLTYNLLIKDGESNVDGVITTPTINLSLPESLLENFMTRFQENLVARGKHKKQYTKKYKKYKKHKKQYTKKYKNKNMKIKKTTYKLKNMRFI
jgi:uncharacterized protein with HEPN domain